MATRGIGVEPVIQGGDDQHAITIDVDIARSCPRPGEVHRVASVHSVAARSEGDLPGCGCRRCSRRDRRCCSRCVAVVAVGVASCWPSCRPVLVPSPSLLAVAVGVGGCYCVAVAVALELRAVAVALGVKVAVGVGVGLVVGVGVGVWV